MTEEEKKLTEYQVTLTKWLTELVEELREMRKKRSREFVLFRLDEVAKKTEMEDSLKMAIIAAIDAPQKPFVINFKPNKS